MNDFNDILDAGKVRMEGIKLVNGYSLDVAKVFLEEIDYRELDDENYPLVEIVLPEGEETTPTASWGQEAEVPLAVYFRGRRYLNPTQVKDWKKYALAFEADIIKAIYSDEWWGGRATSGGTELMSVGNYEIDRERVVPLLTVIPGIRIHYKFSMVNP